MGDARNLSGIFRLFYAFTCFFLLLTISLDYPSTYVKDLRCGQPLGILYEDFTSLSSQLFTVKLKILWTCAQAKCYEDWTKAPRCICMPTSSFNAAKPQPLIIAYILSKRHLCSMIQSIYLTGILSLMYGSCLNTSMILSLSSWMPSMFLSFLKTFSNLL